MTRTTLYILLLCTVQCLSAVAATHVSLQLNDAHQFRFAGYYAAAQQDYFARAGLTVSIESGLDPRGRPVDVVSKVLQGEADFGIAGLDLLLQPDANKQLIILAPLFQRSPSSLVSLGGQPLQRLQDLGARRLVVDNASRRLELQLLLSQQGLAWPALTLVNAPANLASLQQGLADLLLTDAVLASQQSLDLQLDIQQLPLNDYAHPYYGELLFTRRQFAEDYPALTSAFLQAIQQGWSHALNDPNNAIDLLLRDYPRLGPPSKDDLNTDANQYNRRYADLISQYLQYPSLAIGHSDPARWQAIADALLSDQLISDPLKIREILWRDGQQTSGTGVLIPLLTLVLICIGLTLLLTARGHFRPLLAILAVAVIAATLATERWLLNQLREQQQLAQLEYSMQTRARLEGSLNNTLTSIYGLAIYIGHVDKLSEREFNRYARSMMHRDPAIKSLALAPDLVVNMVYPREGNERALGLDYNQNPSQREAALKARDRGAMVLAGPLELVQGGLAFIARAPVYRPDADGQLRFWGLVAAPIDAARLLANAGLDPAGLITPDNPAPGGSLALRGKDGLGRQGQVFYGDESLFEHPDAISVPIRIGADSWVLAAVPEYSAELSSGTLLATRSSGLVVFLLLSLFINLLRKQEKIRRWSEAQLLQNQKLLTEIGDMAQVVGLRVNAAGQVIEIDPRAFDILHLQPRPLPFSSELLIEGLHPMSAQRLLAALRRCAESGERQQLELQLPRADGTSQWLKIIASEQDGDLVGAVQDITRQKNNEQIIREQATIDRVTRLPNRWFFSEQTQLELSRARREHNRLALLFVDVDNFKSINDSLGHAQGDEFLRAIAARLKSCMRESDLLARLGGDEFAVLLRNIEHYNNAYKVAEQIIATMSQAFVLAEHQVFSSVSIGISVFPDDATSTEALLSHADQAMYDCKKSGKNKASFFTLAMQEQSERQHWLYNELVRAIDQQDIQVVFQPIYKLANRQLVDCEALARWPRADGQQISPAEFIPVAESSGLIARLDLLVLRKSLALLEKMPNAGVSVNISPRLFHDAERGSTPWRQLLSEHPHKNRVTVEITERLLVDQQLDAETLLAQLQAEGASISLDDFGTGYSSLSYLSRFNVDKLKIDRSFVMAIGHSKTQETLIETILSMGEKLGIAVVAEGIETEDQLEFLTRRGCRYGQGFLLGRPQPAAELLKLAHEPAGSDKTA